MAYKKISAQIISEGGTGVKSITSYSALCGGTSSTSALQSASSGLSNSGYILTSNGSSSLPTWQAGSPGVAGTLSFMAYMASGSVTFPGTSGYSYGTSVAMTTVFDNTSGAFFAGDGAGNKATFTVPVTGLYCFSIGVNWTSVPSSSNPGTAMVIWVLSGGSGSGTINSFYLNSSVINVSGLGYVTSGTIWSTSGSVVSWLVNTQSTTTSGTIAAGSMSYISGYRIS